MAGFYSSICGDLSTNWTEQLNNTSPDVPTCFQYFDCSIIIVSYTVLCLPYLWWLYRQRIMKRQIKPLYSLKLASIVSLILLQVAEVTYHVITRSNAFAAYILSNCFLMVSLCLILLMALLERRCNAMNSGFYFNYWLITVVVFIVRSRTSGIKFSIGDFQTLVSNVFVFMNILFVSVSLLLSCFSDKVSEDEIEAMESSPNRSKVLKVNAVFNHEAEKIELFDNAEESQNEQKNKPCPENYASFLNRICFYWFTPIIIRGYRHPLTQKDLWALNEEDYCRNIVPVFLKNLKRYLIVESKSQDVPEIEVNGANNNSSKSANKDDSEGNIEEKEVGEVENQPLEQTEDNKPKEKTKFDPSLIYALLRSHWVELLVSGIFKLVHDTLMFASPILLKWLLTFISMDNEPLWKGYMYAVLMLIVSVVRSFILHFYFHMVFRIGMRIRTTLISAVYRKSLVLSTWSRKESTVGEIVNLMSVDSQKFLDLLSYLHMIWSGPFQIIVALVMLWNELGPSVLGGLAIMLLLIPVNAVVGNMTRKLQTQQLKVSDSRIKMMNEILNGIKVLKLYAWETSFMKFVTDIRNKELAFMRRIAYLNAAISFTFNCAPFLVSLTSFGIFVLVSSSNILDAEKAFVSISLFNILRFPLMMLPMVISNFVQASVSVKRLTTFLKRSEIDKDAVQHDDIPKISASIEKGNFTWDPVSNNAFLKNINISVTDGSLVAIVGSVGAGKSSILSALLGEIHKMSGSVNTKGKIAYVPQQAWIINATVRDNILFGQSFDACKYANILDSCCLQRDLEILQDSDLTEIGEKGINLSGGQKQRVSLARACYNNADVYLFDDPLSAVDSHVGKELITKVFGPSGILAGRTRILVTHNLTVLPYCDRVIVMENGEISEEGTYCDLINHAGPFAQYVATHMAEELRNGQCRLDDADELLEKEKILEDIKMNVGSNENNLELLKSLSKSREQIHRSLENIQNEEKEVDDVSKSEQRISESTEKCAERLKTLGVKKDAKNTGKLVEVEVAKEGNVKLSVYRAYIKSVGTGLTAVILFLFLVTQLFSLGSNLWLVRWSSEAKQSANFSRILNELERSSNADQNEIKSIKSYLTHERDINLGIYGVLGLCQALVELTSSIAFTYGVVKSIKKLHDNLLYAVLRTSIRVFESIPVGRILNRFSSDLDAIGMMLPRFISGFIWTALSTMITLIMISLPNAWIVIPLSLTTAFYLFIQRIYVSTSRQLKRLESISKSPIYSHFGETLQGVSSIRAYSLTEKFIQASEEKVDTNLCAYYTNITSNRWLAIILESIGSIIVFLAAIFAVVSKQTGLPISAGLVGLSVSYALNITQTLNWLVRMSSEVESNIVAVERIQEYCQLAPEAPWEISEKKPNDDWPQGMIKFVDYSTRYREGLNLVLNHIDVTINPKEKIGIVGRTGSGKSSLVLALFRILEREEGEIVIDGLPIHELGLHDVRGRITIIPQDPVLFSGTLRKNIDPFSKYTDDELWKVLELSNLKTFVMNSGVEQLGMTISEGGENLSVGQRQLVCLARALLRRTKILVLDEATAAVDLDTDALIQDTIRSEFKDCTILTIAHRLNTVLDYDRIMVLDAGVIVEMDSPDNLLKDQSSTFYAMAKDANLV